MWLEMPQCVKLSPKITLPDSDSARVLPEGDRGLTSADSH